MLVTDYTATTKKLAWKDFVKNFCPTEYRIKCDEWQKCRDAFAGEDAIRAAGEKYLYRPESKKKPAAWKAYLERPKFPSYCKDTLLKMCGILSTGQPEMKLDDLEFFRDWATSDHGGLVALANRVIENVLKFGRYHLLLQVGDTTQGQNLFYIDHFAPEKFLDCDWETEKGESYLTWVLLDDSDVVFDIRTKKRDFDRRLLVLGLDEAGRYYQARIKPEEWEGFDILNPNAGEVEYPAPYGVIGSRIPFFVFNVTDRSFGHYQRPPMIDLVNHSLHLYNADAPYQQTLFMTSDPTLIRKGMPKSSEDPKLGSDVFQDIPADADVKFLEFSGTGANAQLQNIQTMQADADKMGVSIAGIEGAANASGVALEIVRNAQTAALRIINKNIGIGLQNLLRFAFQWEHPGEDRESVAEKIVYSPSNDFADLKASSQEIVQFAMNRKDLMMTREEMRSWIERNAGLEHRDWIELEAELDAESEAEETENFANMDFNRLAGQGNGQEEGGGVNNASTVE